MAAAARSSGDAPHGMLSGVGLPDTDLEDICKWEQPSFIPEQITDGTEVKNDYKLSETLLLTLLSLNQELNQSGGTQLS
jgi:hypothetical protein